MLGRALHPIPLAPVLQWGHDLAVMESSAWSSTCISRCGLQWGHDLAVMESCCLDTGPATASMVAMTVSFNGAMTLRSWRVPKFKSD